MFQDDKNLTAGKVTKYDKHVKTLCNAVAVAIAGFQDAVDEARSWDCFANLDLDCH